MASKTGDSPPPAKRPRIKSPDATGKHGGCHDQTDGGASVSDKLEALKNLVPSESNEETMNPDRLFQETADYIVLLRTQVIVLQKLIDFYGSKNPQENRKSV